MLSRAPSGLKPEIQAVKSKPAYRRKKPAYRKIPSIAPTVSAGLETELAQRPAKCGHLRLADRAKTEQSKYLHLVRPFERLGASGKHSTVWRHWQSFCSTIGMAPSVSKPDENCLRNFVGYLLDKGTAGGDSISSYLSLLPAALAHQQRLLQSAFALPKSVQLLCETLAKEVAPKTPLKRDAATLPTICAIWQDEQLDIAVRAAVVAQYHLGFRGINLYLTSKGSPERALQWRDCTPQGHGSTRSWTIRVRMEKTAKLHTGTFPDKLLVRSQHTNIPCPVQALDTMQASAGMVSQGDIRNVFPGVTHRLVAFALKKHAPADSSLHPHSLRIAAATDAYAAGLTARAVRLKGNWTSTQSADRYVRPTHTSSAREMRALAELPGPASSMLAAEEHHEAAAADAAANLAAAPPASSLIPVMRQLKLHGTLLTNSISQLVYLLAATAKGKWRAYFYSIETHERCLAHTVNGGKKLRHYEPFNDDEIPWLLSNTDALDTEPRGALKSDQAKLESGRGQYRSLTDRLNCRTGDSRL